MRKGKVVSGTMAGLAIGALAGILLAPENGSITRKQIKDKSSDYVDKLKSKLDEFRDSLTAKSESTKKEAEELIYKGKEKFDDAKKNVKYAAANFTQNDAADIYQAIYHEQYY